MSGNDSKTKPKGDSNLMNASKPLVRMQGTSRINTPTGKAAKTDIEKRKATSPLQGQDLQHEKKNRQGSSDMEDKDSETVCLPLDTCEEDIEIVETVENPVIGITGPTHVFSSPMHPGDIIKIASELRTVMAPEIALIHSQIPDMKSVVREAVSDIMQELMRPFREEMAFLKSETDVLKTELDQLKKDNKELSDKVYNMEKSSDAQEQYSRRNSLRISGITETDGENTNEIVLKLASELDLSIGSSDIDRSHRVGRVENTRRDGSSKTKRQHRDIIVKFATYNARQKLYNMRKDLRHTEDMKSIFVNEDLTKYRSKLLFDARTLARVAQISTAYSSDGKIFVRDNENKRHLIQSEEDITKFGSVTEAKIKLSERNRARTQGSSTIQTGAANR